MRGFIAYVPVVLIALSCYGCKEEEGIVPDAESTLEQSAGIPDDVTEGNDDRQNNNDSDDSLGPTEIEGYQLYDIEGFSVYVQDLVFQQSEDLAAEAVELVESDLTEVLSFSFSDSATAIFRSTKIFIDWRTTDGAAVYHPNPQWLAANGYIPEKANSIEISNVTNYINWTQQNQPFLMLHELSHAYHFNLASEHHEIIKNAFDIAMNKGLYFDIPYDHGNGSFYDAEKAYATTNEYEFFAELSEAYYGQNDYFPFNLADLERYDRKSSEMIQTIWNLFQ